MKKKRPDPYLIDDENPEWTDEMFRDAISGRKFFTKLLGKAKAEAFFRENRKRITNRGRPRKARPKFLPH